jgi:hypothetical protein
VTRNVLNVGRNISQYQELMVDLRNQTKMLQMYLKKGRNSPIPKKLNKSNIIPSDNNVPDKFFSKP